MIEHKSGAPPMSGVQLVVFDMDGTLTRGSSSIWARIHKRLGVSEQANKNMQMFFDGQIPYSEWSRRDSALWKGKLFSDVADVAEVSEILPGARALMEELKRHGIQVAIVSGGLDVMAYRIADAVGVERCNVVTNTIGVVPGSDPLVMDGTVKTNVSWSNKDDVVRDLAARLGVDLKNVCHVGDGDNDIPAFNIVGHSIGINTSSDAVKEAVQHIVSCSDLRSLLPILLPPAKIAWIAAEAGKCLHITEQEKRSEYHPEDLCLGCKAHGTTGESLIEDIAALSSTLTEKAQVFCSPLQHAISTGARLFPGSRLFLDDRISDIITKVPEESCRESATAILEKFGKGTVDVRALSHNIPWMPISEPLDQVAERMNSFREDIESSLGPDETVFVVSHPACLEQLFGHPVQMNSMTTTLVPMHMYHDQAQHLARLTHLDDSDKDWIEALESQTRLLTAERKIIEESLPVGVYEGESCEEWVEFFGQLMKKHTRDVPRELSSQIDTEAIARLLKQLGCTPSTPAHEILRRFEEEFSIAGSEGGDELREQFKNLSREAAALCFEQSAASKKIIEAEMAKGKSRREALETLSELREQKASETNALLQKLCQNMKCDITPEQFVDRALLEAAVKRRLVLRTRGAIDDELPLISNAVLHRLDLKEAIVVPQPQWLISESQHTPYAAVIDRKSMSVIAIVEFAQHIFDISEAHEHGEDVLKKWRGKDIDVNVIRDIGDEETPTEETKEGAESQPKVHVDDTATCYVCVRETNEKIPMHLRYSTCVRNHLDSFIAEQNEMHKDTSPMKARECLLARFGHSLSPKSWLDKYGTTLLFIIPHKKSSSD